MGKKTRKTIDLFCGCGGLSVGLSNAGMDVIAGIDIEPTYISSFKRNFPDSEALVLDLSKKDPLDFMRDIKLSEGELFILAGGPPCQGFSKNVPRSKRTEKDPNNLLINTYIQYCKALKPELILMENVAEMKNGFGEFYSNVIHKELEEIGYNMTSLVLNAADYGVPQRRKRAFFLGIKFPYKIPKMYPIYFKTQEAGLFDNQHISVWDAISDLPSVKHDDCFEKIKYRTEPQNDFQARMRLNHNSQYVLNHHPRKLRDKQFARINALEPGQGLKDLPSELRIKGGYSGAYGRLTDDMVAPTITRWVFHPGSGRWGHPRDKRLITIREAARIQSFPDYFEFVGSYTQQAGQIGNAVPPILVEEIVRHMMQYYESKISNSPTKSSNESFSDFEGKLKVAT